MKRAILIIITLGIITSCVSTKEFESGMSSLKYEIASMQREIVSLENELSRHNQIIYRLQSTVSNLESKREVDKQKHSEEIQLLEMRIADFENRDENLRDLISRLRIEVIRLQSRSD
jgi:predicted RNase H-like nuclease (RuvC/YqgF family)